ncbi:MAG: sigma-70 family RNA polymerase sigma factor [Saprospiraceae bacterium]|nr:sigma-70 family RNA polymerase sigma factor [Saprospiraceae bacterium]
MAEREALEQLKNGDMEALGWVYQRFRDGFVKRMIRKWNITYENAIDLFLEIVVLFEQKVRSGSFTEIRGGGIGGWIYRAGNNILNESKRHAKRTKLFDEIGEEIPYTEPDTEKEELLRLTEQGMRQIEEKCRNLLNDHYINGNSIEQLKEAWDFQSVAAAKQKLYRCREALKKAIFNIIV